MLSLSLRTASCYKEALMFRKVQMMGSCWMPLNYTQR